MKKNLLRYINAQDLKVPQPSTLQIIQQDFGLGQITITYSRPNVKGRKIFGNIEPYGMVWRTGANAATKFKLTDSIWIEKHALAPGEYALFTIPGPNEWTVIFNKKWNQWGTEYNEADDALRITTDAVKSNQFTEKMTFKINKEGRVTLLWGDKEVSFLVN